MPASVPADIMAIAITTLYAVPTHCRTDSTTFISDWMPSNATFTISESSKIMKRPRPVAGRVKRCVLVIAGDGNGDASGFRRHFTTHRHLTTQGSQPSARDCNKRECRSARCAQRHLLIGVTGFEPATSRPAGNLGPPPKITE